MKNGARLIEILRMARDDENEEWCKAYKDPSHGLGRRE